MKNKMPRKARFQKSSDRRHFNAPNAATIRFILTTAIIVGILGWSVIQGNFPEPPSDVAEQVSPPATTQPKKPTAPLTTLQCSNPYVFDGDTFECAGQRVRLSSIDAPEMAGHCKPGRKCTPGDPVAAKNHLRKLTRGQIECKVLKTDHYNRLVAQCFNGAGNIECDMVRNGHAVQRYGRLSCPESRE